ncbi:MAG TPA: HAMP domain-containing sensor histidine kinase [Nitrososphaeraceae archaeon]
MINKILDIFLTAVNSINICGNSKFPSQLLRLELTRKAILTTKNNGVRQRYLFEITKDNIQYCKNFMQIIDHDDFFRHSDEIENNFVANEKEYLGSITLREPTQHATYSNMRDIVEQQLYIFETLWNKAIRVEDKIREIEQGIEPEFYQVITDYEKAREKYLELSKSIEKEGLLLLANSIAMVRAHKLGVIDYLIEASTKKGANIRIICPLTEENSEIVKTISDKAPDIRILNGGGSSHSGLFITDKTKFMKFELKEPKAEKFSEAIGFIVYSNNKVGVESSKSFFELIWNERIQQEKLKEYEKLKEADKVKTEFINVAAHELRTPIQPILGLCEVLRSERMDIEKHNELLDVIIRNAKRLQRLTEDILDVTKIESQSLKLNKQRLNLNDIISSITEDYRNQIGKANVSLEVLYDNHNNNDLLEVEADKGRITQVISNLLSNAIKFTNEGVISIISEKKDSQVIVSIKDTGKGIDEEIFPKLFTKFTSKSFAGTGLGLFISKSIVEAHGGKIWAENSPDGKGATFAFSLPLLIKQ